MDLTDNILNFTSFYLVTIAICSGLMEPDTLIRDNAQQLLRCPVLLDQKNWTLSVWCRT